MSNKSVEKVVNQGLTGGLGMPVTAVSEVGAVSNRTPVTVTETAQVLAIATGKTAIEFYNAGSNTIYYGGSGVTSANGRPLTATDGVIFNRVKETFTIYVVCASGQTSTLNIIEYA